MYEEDGEGGSRSGGVEKRGGRGDKIEVEEEDEENWILSRINSPFNDVEG